MYIDDDLDRITYVFSALVLTSPIVCEHSITWKVLRYVHSGPTQGSANLTGRLTIETHSIPVEHRYCVIRGMHVFRVTKT